MKGKYINTVIMQAALAGKRSRRKAVKETVTSLDNHKIIWSKEGAKVKIVNANPETALLD